MNRGLSQQYWLLPVEQTVTNGLADVLGKDEEGGVEVESEIGDGGDEGVGAMHMDSAETMKEPPR